jgi:GNAT superfamily N-acetyltransferase
MSSLLAIAPAQAADREALLRLLAAQFQELEIPLPAERLAQAVDGVLEDPSRGTFLLGRAGGRAAGLAYLSYQWTLEHGGRVAWLEELFVEPELRSQGLGAQLLEAACAHARSQACAAVDLEVEEAHPRAANLYSRAGFRPLNRKRWVKAL